MQDLKDIEEVYKEHRDPWGYQTNAEDAKRKERILSALKPFGKFDRALDIGAGEGWITQDLPAIEICGYECSDSAASRFPKHVQRVDIPFGRYDLVTATGIMYGHYHYRDFINMVIRHASKIFLTTNIRKWEVPDLEWFLPFRVYEEIFPYNEHEQHLQVFDMRIQT